MPANLEIVAASLIRPLFGELERAGMPVNRLAQRSGLPGATLESSVSHLPRAATQRFVQDAVSATGDKLLLYGVSSAGIAGLVKLASAPIFGRKLPVYERLNRFLGLASNTSSAVSFYTRVTRDRLWIIRVNSEKREHENWHFELYAIGALETAVSQLFGATIRPVSIRLRSQPRPDSMPNHWRAADISLYQHQSAIAVPLKVLRASADVQTPLLHPHRTPLDDGVNTADLIAVVSEYARDSRGIDQVSNAFGMNRRTFQRCLTRQNLTYSVLVEEIRFHKAMELIKTPGVMITEAALETGYSNAENFTRAFRRRYGVTPTGYRKLLERD